LADRSRNSASIRRIPSTQILAEIEQGKPAEHNEVKIEGDLIIGYANLPVADGKTRVRSAIKITNCQFEGKVTLGRTVFLDSVDFRGSTFHKQANFSGSVFNSVVDFGNARFADEVSFNKCQFEDEASFNRAVFEKKAFFSKSLFKKESYFRKSVFKEDLSFNRCQFEGDSYFRECEFHKEASFRKASYIHDADFSRSRFLGEASLESAHLLGDTFFTDASFEEGLVLNLTKYEKLHIRWKSLTRPKYQWRYLECLERTSKLKFDDSDGETAYLLLIDNFKKLGFLEDADDCYYQYRNERRPNLPAHYRPIDWILMVSYGYGVRPIRPLALSAGFFMAFALFYAAFGGFFSPAGAPSIAEAANLSLTLLLSGSKLIPDPNPAATGALYFIYTSEKLIGSFFFALLLISVGRTIIR